jgi:hypothetical protein
MGFFTDRNNAKKKLDQTRRINRINSGSSRNISRRESSCDCDDNFGSGVITGIIISNMCDDSDSNSDYGDD